MVAYQKWALKVSQEKEKRIQEVVEERRKKLKEEYFKEQAKRQRKKGYLGQMKQLVHKHMKELKTTNDALTNAATTTADTDGQPQSFKEGDGQEHVRDDPQQKNTTAAV